MFDPSFKKLSIWERGYFIDYMAYGGSIHTDVIDLKNMGIQYIFKHHGYYKFSFRGWRLIDSEFQDDDIIITCIPKMMFKQLRKEHIVTSEFGIMEVIIELKDNKLSLRANGSANKKVTINIEYGKTNVKRKYKLRSGDVKEIKLLPEVEEPIVLLVHSKSYKLLKKFSIETFAKEVFKMLNINGSEVILDTGDINITIELGSKKIEEKITPEIAIEL